MRRIGAHVLAVDDDPLILEVITNCLGDHDLRVTGLTTGREIAEVMARETIDLIVLDIRLPGEDGMQIARELRAQSDIPLIMLTGRREEADRVMSLELGADDYVTKPFSPRELLARIRALLRRSQVEQSVPQELRKIQAYRFCGHELNTRRRRLTTPRGVVLELSNNEFNLLAAFLASPHRVLSRDQLLTRSRLHNSEVYERSVDVQIGRLRKKIDPEGTLGLIRTERGSGYVFEPAVEIVR